MHLPIKLAAGTVLAFTAAGTAQEVTVASWGDSHQTAQSVQLAGWPSNVLVGFLVGFGIIFLSEKAYDRFKKHADYKMQIREIGIRLDASDSEIEEIGDKIPDIAYALGVPVEHAVEALRVIDGSGAKNYDEAWSMMRPTIKAARLSGASFEDTAKTLKAVSEELTIDPRALPRVIDTILAGGREEGISAKDLLEQLPDILPTAVADRGYAGGLGLEQLIADLQTIRSQVRSDGPAVEQLEAFYSEFSSEEFRQRLEEAGYDVKGALEDADKAGTNKGTALLNLIAGDVLETPELIPQLFHNEQSAAAAKAILLNPEEWRRNRPSVD